MKKAIVFMADGMEECECLITVDLLKRAGIEVRTASVMGRREVVSTHGITVMADLLADELDYEAADAVILPGGLPGADYLAENSCVQKACRSYAENEAKTLAAICAAPRVLAGLGLLEGRSATVYPGLEADMKNAVVRGAAVTVDGNIITGRALGSAIPFALEIITALLGRSEAERVAEEIHY